MDAIRNTAGRIALVHATEGHAPLLYRIFTGTATQKYNPVVVTDPRSLALQLRKSGTDFTEHASQYRFFGEYEELLFGTFILKNIDWPRNEGEIGYSLLDAWQGRGLGTALVYAGLTHIYGGSTIDSLWATVSVTNIASQKILLRLGFRDCGLYEKPFIIQGQSVTQTLYRTTRKQFMTLA